MASPLQHAHATHATQAAAVNHRRRKRSTKQKAYALCSHFFDFINTTKINTTHKCARHCAHVHRHIDISLAYL